MNYPRLALMCRRVPLAILVTLLSLGYFVPAALAHPLGNFTVNHYARLEVGAERIHVRYVVDMAEIATFQELQAMDKDGDGSPSSAELSLYAERAATDYTSGLLLTVDGARIPLRLVEKQITLPPGMGGLSTLRLECDFDGLIPANGTNAVRRLRFEDTNHQSRIGWREVVVSPTSGINVFNSSAFGNGLTDELKAYPNDMLAAPLNERTAEFSFLRGAIPAGATPLRTRDGRQVEVARDRLAELIAVPELTFGIALFGLLLAAVLGGFHALSPGHGKTVVAAYLIGSRGTARHAAFLGLTVTITHTAGVFALGLVTLFAAQYVVPERLYPILSFISGAIVLVIGFSLFVRRFSVALGYSQHDHGHHHHTHDDHAHDHAHEDHDHSGDSSLVHSHGGHVHSHLPPGVDGSPVTWRNLLALGVSGGLLPCPSALVVLLSAISLHRVGYGLLLVVAFSFGLASVLTAIGLTFVYARRFIERPLSSSGRLIRVLPVLSAFVITCAGAVICYEALAQAGVSLSAGLGFLSPSSESANQTGWLTVVSLLGFGFALGLKHAIEADHIAAVTTIASERKSIFSASLVGGLWGVGHTISLLIAGIAVILLRVEISKRMEMALEFCVALMLIGLGINAIRKLTRGGEVHLHAHRHGGHLHFHPHIHDGAPEPDVRSHHG